MPALTATSAGIGCIPNSAATVQAGGRWSASAIADQDKPVVALADRTSSRRSAGVTCARCDTPGHPARSTSSGDLWGDDFAVTTQEASPRRGWAPAMSAWRWEKIRWSFAGSSGRSKSQHKCFTSSTAVRSAAYIDDVG